MRPRLKRFHLFVVCSGITYAKFIYLCRVLVSHSIHIYFLCFLFAFVWNKAVPFFCSAILLECVSRFDFQEFLFKKIVERLLSLTMRRHIPNIQWIWRWNGQPQVFSMVMRTFFELPATNTHFAYHSISIRWQLSKATNFDHNFE